MFYTLHSTQHSLEIWTSEVSLCHECSGFTLDYPEDFHEVTVLHSSAVFGHSICPGLHFVLLLSQLFAIMMQCIGYNIRSHHLHFSHSSVSEKNLRRVCVGDHTGIC